MMKFIGGIIALFFICITAPYALGLMLACLPIIIIGYLFFYIFLGISTICNNEKNKKDNKIEENKNNTINNQNIIIYEEIKSKPKITYDIDFIKNWINVEKYYIPKEELYDKLILRNQDKFLGTTKEKEMIMDIIDECTRVVETPKKKMKLGETIVITILVSIFIIYLATIFIEPLNNYIINKL